VFTPAELIRIAVQMERNGEQFYEGVAAKTPEAFARGIFEQLAAAERQHIKDFEAIGDQFSDQQAWEQHEGELEKYASALLESRVFAEANAGRSMAEAAVTSLDAANAAVAFEKDTILFLHEMRAYLTGGAQPAVEELLRQERQHLVSLWELRAHLADR
jgi:rubrerythrin